MSTNRLINEKSPYLLQHAHNPVDWYPWGEEAREKARKEDKPIFLSIGYSTCHWCHVMERESFENEDVARVLNEHFVPVKVDREERPDLDRVYMLFVQASTGSGGWPMSVWMTPEGKPFFGGTYFPPDTRYGRPGFRTILESLARAWRDERPRIEQSGAQVIEQLRHYGEAQNGSGGKPAAIGQHTLDAAFHAFRRSFDARLGGFGGAPKFPRPSVLNFLLRYASATGNEDARDMVLVTLRAMARGGMHDQLGGGFHRYSVDEHWFVPHFEKMLYDQAQLAISYLEAYQITGDAQYADVARDVLDYVLRDLTHPEGGFYSAEDADSAPDPARPKEKSEGAFYIWTRQEIVDALGEQDAAVFSRHFGVKPNGNVDEDPHGEFTGRNILYQAQDQKETVPGIAKLLEIRSRRPRPHLDDKVLAGWNGLMISAFAKGAQILDEQPYAQAARAARSFLHRKLWREADATLLRRFRDGDAAIEAFLDDYASLINALVDLYETAFDPSDLAWATRLAERALAAFQDAEHGGFFSSIAGQSDLVLRLKDDYDGAEPSGNSVMALALLRLARLTGRDDFRQAAERTLESFAGRILSGGAGLPQLLVAQMFAMGKPMEIVLAGPRDQLTGMLHVIRQRFLPNAIVMRASEAPVAMTPTDGLATAYVCENYACKLPVTDAGALAELLQ
ncbi:MAG TPA: thioredoxin domain-containing protein [Bryobacteraceae bacterium]|nr:thioredoxin domain-containing protein [Bryobacteraceae bacterium]